jgi:hypothetical protein
MKFLISDPLFVVAVWSLLDNLLFLAVTDAFWGYCGWFRDLKID